MGVLGPDTSLLGPGRRRHGWDLVSESLAVFVPSLAAPQDHTLKQLVCLLVTEEKHIRPDSFSSYHAVQSQRLSKHFYFSVLGGGNPIYSLIFRTLRGAVKDPTRGTSL